MRTLYRRFKCPNCGKYFGDIGQWNIGDIGSKICTPCQLQINLEEQKEQIKE